MQINAVAPVVVRKLPDGRQDQAKHDDWLPVNGLGAMKCTIA